MATDTIAPEYLRRAEALHREAVVIDTHCDTTQHLLSPSWDFNEEHEAGHIDLPRLRAGGITAQFFAVYVRASAGVNGWVGPARQQFAALHQLARRFQPDLVPATRPSEVRTAKQRGRIAILIGVEGGHLIEDSLDILREYRKLGATYLTLTHAFHINWADSAGVHEDLPPRHNGLTAFGRKVVAELNALGMMVDVSHVSDKTFWDVIETSRAPVIATHSNCRAVHNHRRNLTDEMIRAIADRGGVVQLNFASYFIDPHHPEPTPEELKIPSLEERWRKGAPGGYVTPLAALLDHFDHAISLVGPEHVGIGTDYDGVPFVPRGLEHCGRMHNLTAALLQRCHAEGAVRLILGENVLRVMEACLRTAEEPEQDRPMELD